MPLPKYGVLAGKAVAARREDNEDTPHYQVEVRASGTHYRIAVNVRSSQKPPDLLHLIKENFAHPILARLTSLAEEFTLLELHERAGEARGVAGGCLTGHGLRALPVVPIPAPSARSTWRRPPWSSDTHPCSTVA